MQQKISLRLLPSEAQDPSFVQQQIAKTVGTTIQSVQGYHILKQSIDARGKQAMVNLTVMAFINEPYQERLLQELKWKDVHQSKHRVVIAGAGPAGLFAALRLIEWGIQPIIIERGKDVRARRRDLALLNREGIVNPESNYCFGEGGAGTYSDGKLYTRSNKRGNIDRILQLFYHFGAEETILYQSHPHIGTNKLPQIITSIRNHILECGGAIHFETKLTAILTNDQKFTGVTVQNNATIKADALILATGHSARDVFELLHQQKILIESKPFALGVRVEHPQSIIDSIQYHCKTRDTLLPPASYSLVEQVRGRGVFSFCMCPGGIIAPASTAPGELVVNGWSPSKRNNAFSNSGIVVSVDQKDAYQFLKKKALLDQPTVRLTEDHPLLLMYFQKAIEQKAFETGGGKMVAPAQRMADLFDRKTSSTLPSSSYIPGLQSSDLKEVLPSYLYEDLRLAFQGFGKKMKGYFTNEAIAVATESRTSSPVRIPRNANTLEHDQVAGLYPCGEGAGYAGGIVSAAMDGENVADAIAAQFNRS